MDLAEAVRTLWRHKLWLVLAAVLAAAAAILTLYRPVGWPPKLESRNLEFGTAQTQVLVDSNSSPLAALDRDFEPLAARAAVYAGLMQSAPVARLIYQVTGIGDANVATALARPLGRQGEEDKSNRQERNQQLFGEGNGYSLTSAAGKGSPIVTIVAQGPSGEGAIRLANGAATALRLYVEHLQAAQKVAEPEQVKLRQLGAARGGIVNDGVSRRAAALAALAVFGGFSLLILLVVHLRAGDQAPPLPGWAVNGHEASPNGHERDGAAVAAAMASTAESAPQPEDTAEDRP